MPLSIANSAREDARSRALPGDDLGRFRWHTGAQPERVSPESAPALLFRDIGPVAMAQFLRTGLTRLAGPMTPITYLRTAGYREPYQDYGAIGRLVVLRPMELVPWCAGLPHIYIAAAHRLPAPDALGFVPSGVALDEATRRLTDATTALEAREAFAACDTPDARAAHLAHLDALNHEWSATETMAQPIRIAFQTGVADTRERLRESFARHGIDEADLCAAWHHLPAPRREWLKEILPRLWEETASCRNPNR